jgi:hypothetical protein
MPMLDRGVIRQWLEDHNWSIKRLAEECSAIGDDSIPEGTMRNAVNGIDPMRPGRIRLSSKVTSKYGEELTYSQLLGQR